MVGHGVTITAAERSVHSTQPVSTAVVNFVMAAEVGVASAQASCTPTLVVHVQPPLRVSVNPPSSGSIQR